MAEYLEKTDDGAKITEEGYAKLSQILTDPHGQVYAFNGNVSPVTVAAAMARLSRRGDDMRITLLDEFIGQDKKDAALIQRVVSAYGDDSVQQLTGIQVVVEGASNLLTKLLEWGRLAAYLEQSTRYIFFDQLDADGKYKFYTPKSLPEPTRIKYDTTLTRIFELYSEMARSLTEKVRQTQPFEYDASSRLSEKSQRIAWQGATRAEACDAIRPVLPTATKSTVGIYASGQAYDSLIMHLLSEPLPEAIEVGRQLLKAGREIIPAFLERTDIPERGGAIVAYRAKTRKAVRELTDRLLSDQPVPAVGGPSVKLVNVWPQNEDEVLAEMLFEASRLPLDAIRQKVATLSDAEKEEICQTYIGERLNRRHRPGRALEIPHLEWEIVGDYGSFRDLQRHRMVDAFEWQRLSPDFGYEVPTLVTKFGLEASFQECFRLSNELYAHLVESGFDTEAQYATLLGHRMRYRFALNMRAFYHFVELRSQPAGHAGYRWIAQQMFDQAIKVYPRFCAGMRQFVNQDENPELTRLAAERATQDKLARLDKILPSDPQ